MHSRSYARDKLPKFRTASSGSPEESESKIFSSVLQRCISVDRVVRRHGRFRCRALVLICHRARFSSFSNSFLVLFSVLVSMHSSNDPIPRNHLLLDVVGSSQRIPSIQNSHCPPVILPRFSFSLLQAVQSRSSHTPPTFPFLFSTILTVLLFAGVSRQA